MLGQRILTVAVALPLFLAALFLLDNLYWGLLLIAVLAIAGREWARLAGYGPLYPPLTEIPVSVNFSKTRKLTHDPKQKQPLPKSGHTLSTKRKPRRSGVFVSGGAN